MNFPMITRDITIAGLTENYPFSVGWLSQRGIRCIRCGEPIWGTLAEAAREKGFSDSQIDDLVTELIALTDTYTNPENK